MCERWMNLMRETGAIQQGHFLLSSGRHSAEYVQCARALEHPSNAATLGGALADEVRAKAESAIDFVVSPPLGALLIGYEVARRLDVRFLFPEREGDGRFRFRRGFVLDEGAHICLVEDVITTGRTTEELIDLVESMGTTVAAVAAIADRSTGRAVRSHPIVSLLQLEIPTYAPEECPLCAKGSSPIKPGSRAEPDKGGR